MSLERNVRWLDEREQATWRAFLHTHASLMAQLGREMQDASGLSNADYAVLVRVSEHPDRRVRVLELARALLWEKSRLSHQLTRMEQRGLLTRVTCSEDRRGAFVELTEAGSSAVAAVAPLHVESVRRYLFDDLTDEQITCLREVCETVIAKLPGGAAAPGDSGGCCGVPDG